MPPPKVGRPDDVAALERGAAALGLELTARQSGQLLDYLGLLSKWNRVYNLSAIRDPAAMLVQHVLDSMTAVVPLRRWTRGRPARLIDVGSGAGLPGLVLAVLMPELGVTCVDAVGKKVAFVRAAAASLVLRNLHALHARVEEVREGPFDIVTSRAFASLADFTRETRHLLGAGGVWMAMKGKDPVEELATLPEDVEVFHVERVQVPNLQAARCLVWMRKRSTTD